MKLLMSYIKKNRKWLFLFIAFVGVFLGTFYLYHISTEAVRYACLLCAGVTIIFVCMDFVKYYRKYIQLENELFNIHVEVNKEIKTEDLFERCYREMIEQLFSDKMQMESKNGIEKQEMLDYYGLWVHQIKTPIAAMRLLLQNSKELSFERRTELELELFKIEQYVEMALSYIRIGDMSSDLRLSWYSIDDIIKPAVRKYSKMFILNKIKLQYEPIREKVLTDEKWLGFVIEQILSNALKYTKEGSITISMDKGKPKVLVIEDTGIGIWKEDLPRVFEKGFTGYNGRTDKKSTGIGLYLCKTIVDKLNHRIYISSEIGKGTKLFLNLERDDFQVE